MKLPEKLKAAKITYAGAPPAELSLGEEARTINALIDYLAEGEVQVSGSTFGVSSNFGPVTTVPSLPHEPVVAATPLFKATWQDESDETSKTTLGHLIEKHNELCDYLEDYLKAQAEQAKEALLKLTE